MLTSDSRWSIESFDEKSNLVAYVDDTGFDKLAVSPQFAMVFAGNARLIEEWKAWFAAPVLALANRPATMINLAGGKQASVTIGLVEKSTGEMRFSAGMFMSHREKARFSGSGAQYAKDCYAVNGCGMKAVNSAAVKDHFTGGETKYIQLRTGSMNLSILPGSKQDMINAMQQRGFVMDTNTKTVTAMSDWKSPTADAQKAISAGIDTLSAPTGLPPHQWTVQEENDLDQALLYIAQAEGRLG
ncbi:hypothetical protein [Pseudomonas putida]|uniref:hypothetical protein n=1 Tax=Pseudomonas putida TaxID=303 RepID=UPI0018ABCFCD|nr:hypothetical protein [Pseudomonas putida]MBF8726136.1 hypothetical protein [Pseudomonas putida]